MILRRDNVIEVVGAITTEKAEEFRNLLTALAAEGHARIDVDLAACTLFTSVCIAHILVARNKLLSQGRKLVITQCSDELRESFHLLRLSKLIPLAESPQSGAPEPPPHPPPAR